MIPDLPKKSGGANPVSIYRSGTALEPAPGLPSLGFNPKPSIDLSFYEFMGSYHNKSRLNSDRTMRKYSISKILCFSF